MLLTESDNSDDGLQKLRFKKRQREGEGCQRVRWEREKQNRGKMPERSGE